MLFFLMKKSDQLQRVQVLAVLLLQE